MTLALWLSPVFRFHLCFIKLWIICYSVWVSRSVTFLLLFGRNLRFCSFDVGLILSALLPGEEYIDAERC